MGLLHLGCLVSCQGLLDGYAGVPLKPTQRQLCLFLESRPMFTWSVTVSCSFQACWEELVKY